MGRPAEMFEFQEYEAREIERHNRIERNSTWNENSMATSPVASAIAHVVLLGGSITFSRIKLPTGSQGVQITIGREGRSRMFTCTFESLRYKDFSRTMGDLIHHHWEAT